MLSAVASYYYIDDDQGAGVDGIIVSNTTLQRPNTLCSKWKVETGGLSGRPLKHIATSIISEMYILTEGNCGVNRVLLREYRTFSKNSALLIIRHPLPNDRNTCSL
jgi:hypothetical protein